MGEISITQFDAEQMLRLLDRYLQEAPDTINGEKDGDKEMAKYLIERISISCKEEKRSTFQKFKDWVRYFDFDWEGLFLRTVVVFTVVLMIFATVLIGAVTLKLLGIITDIPL